MLSIIYRLNALSGEERQSILACGPTKYHGTSTRPLYSMVVLRVVKQGEYVVHDLIFEDASPSHFENGDYFKRDQVEQALICWQDRAVALANLG